MSKRFATIFFIMIGVVIFLLSAFLLVLLLAPGVSIFGIKYITLGTHKINTGKVLIENELAAIYGDGSFSKSLIINSSEVPVFVEFADAGTGYYYQYYDNFSGITKSSFTDPSIILEKDENGNAVLTVKSFDTFIFQNANSERFLKVFIPLANISVNDYVGKPLNLFGADDPGASLKYSTNLTINAGNADVDFRTGDKNRAAAFNNFTVNTTGKFALNGTHIKAMNFYYSTDKNIRVYYSYNLFVDAKNYYLSSTGGKIICQKEIVGTLSAETKNGDILLMNCGNVIAKSDLGDIKKVDDEYTLITKKVDIVTNAGSVEFDSITGNEKSTITTSGGSVRIGKMLDGTVNTHRGSITIGSARNIIASSEIGKIDIDQVLASAEISSNRGNVFVGEKDMVVSNIKLSSNIGDIKVLNTSGAVYIDSIKSDIYFENNSSQNIQIFAGHKLTAKNLKGAVNITLSGESYLEFDNVSNDTKILLKSSCSYVKIDALSTVRTNLNYFVYGNPASIYESNNTGYATFSLIESDKYLFNSKTSAIKFEVIGDSKNGTANAKVDIYFDRTPNY